MKYIRYRLYKYINIFSDLWNLKGLHLKIDFINLKRSAQPPCSWKDDSDLVMLKT